MRPLSTGVSESKHWNPDELNDRPFSEKWWDDFTFWTEYPQLAWRKGWIHAPTDFAWFARMELHTNEETTNA